MRIAIDMSQILYGTGVSHYRYNLVKNLLKIDKENEYLLYGGSLRQLPNLKERLSRFSGNVLTKTFPLPPTGADILWNKLHILPIEKFIGNADLIHTSDWAEPPSKITKITTIHDLVPFKVPRYTPKVIINTFKKKIEWVYKESRKIIVPSNSTKQDLIELGFEDKRIEVIYEAPNLSKSSKEQIELVKRKFGLFENYIIAIGTNPRKNIKRMVEAYHLSKSGKNLKFVIVGEKHEVDLVNERGVRFLGRVSDADLSALLTGSKALIFASLYEGLGIPILDAMACEVPVVTSKISSMTEAGGDAAVFIDPENINSIAGGIEEALNKPKTLIAKGLKHVTKFSWEDTATKTLNTYKALKTSKVS